MSLAMAMLLWSSITARGVIDPMAVAGPAGADSRLYFVLRNSVGREDWLRGVTCTCAARVEIADEGGSRPGAWPIAMPPTRLVELRPGGSRHLVLRGLTRPLVAGQTVTMTFRYADGSDEREVRIVADADAGWRASGPGRGARMPPAMQALAGWCWRGAHADGRRTDTRCFSPAYGWFIQDRHTVETEGVPTTEYRLYARDVMARATRFESTDPDGVIRFGSVVPDEAGVSFVQYGPDRAGMLAGTERVRWRPDGADAWQVIAETRRPDGWRELERLRMVRAGRAPAL